MTSAAGPRKVRPGFTLVELLLVMLIISLMIAILLPQLPAVVNQVKGMQTGVLLGTLSLGIESYRQTYGNYPTSCYADGTSDPFGYPSSGAPELRYGAPGPKPAAYQQCTAYSLWVMLQGPEGLGWKRSLYGPKGSTTKSGLSKDFGPYPESVKDNVGYDNIGAWDKPKLKPIFIDAFGKPVLYFKARRDAAAAGDPNFGNYGSGVFNAFTARVFWYQQANLNSVQLGDTNTNLHMTKRAKIGTANVGTATAPKIVDLVANTTSYLLWTAGADQRFGYWFWRKDETTGKEGYDFSNMDSVKGPLTDQGTCDDIVNF